jgi:hypothetical protein
MSLRELCQRWLADTIWGRKPAKPRHRPRLTVEQLEDRTVPSNFTAASVTDLIADINAANAAGGSNTITLVAGTTFTLTAVNNTTDGPTGLPVIAANDNLTILGNGDTIERKASGSTPAFRLLDVAAGATLTLENLMLQGGLAFGGQGLASSEGGAIYNQGALTLTGVTVQNNTAQGLDGSKGGAGGSAAGGGIYSGGGSLTLEGCTLQNNQALGGQGGQGFQTRDYFGDRHDRYPGGNGGDGLGGGLYVAAGTASLHNSTVTGNKALGGQGGGGGASAGLGEGGGVFIAPAASVCLDAFTQANVKKNTASTTGDDIFGTFTTCS